MKRFILIGPSGCGKSTLCEALYGLPAAYKKTQAVELLADAIDTPGEYLENRRLYRALAVSAVEAEVVVLVQEPAGRRAFPPGFGGMFGGKPVYGVVSKADLPADPQLRAAAGRELLDAGARRIFHTSALSREGVAELLEALR